MEERERERERAWEEATATVGGRACDMGCRN